MELIKATKNIYLLAGMSVCFTACMNTQGRSADECSGLIAEVRPLNPIVLHKGFTLLTLKYARCQMVEFMYTGRVMNQGMHGVLVRTMSCHRLI